MDSTNRIFCSAVLGFGSGVCGGGGGATTDVGELRNPAAIKLSLGDNTGTFFKESCLMNFLTIDLRRGLGLEGPAAAAATPQRSSVLFRAGLGV